MVVNIEPKWIDVVWWRSYIHLHKASLFVNTDMPYSYRVANV